MEYIKWLKEFSIYDYSQRSFSSNSTNKEDLIKFENYNNYKINATN